VVDKKLFLLTFALASPFLPAWDFPERPAAAVLSPAPDGFALGSAGYAQTAYRVNEWMNTRIDKFQVEAFGHHGVVDISKTRLSAFYGTHMLNGPVNQGDRPGAEASQWMMNAIQYEYGLVLSWYPTPGRFGRPALLAEYGRRSYHPLRGDFNNPSADILRFGAALLDMPLPWRGKGSLDLMARITWSELYDFWGAPTIPDPRALYTLHLAAEGQVGLGVSGIGAFLLAMPDLIYLRNGGSAMDLAVQGGLRFGRSGTADGTADGSGRFARSGAALELFVDYHYSSDTEQLVRQASPATLLGYGIRFVVRTAHLPFRT